MLESPNTLLELCLDNVCENILIYIEPEIRDKSGWLEKLRSGDSFDEDIGKFRFKDPDIFLISEIAEKLIVKFCEKRLLRDATLHLFTKHNTNLRKFKIKNCKVTKNGLQILKQHKVLDLECVNLKDISIGEVLDCLTEWSTENMLSVNFSKCTFIDELRFSFMVKLAYLKKLRCLNLSFTELNQSTFKILCDDLKYLEKLDVSSTLINDVAPLTQLSSRLTSLSICDLYHVDSLESVLEQLKLLRHLDLSLINEKIENQHVDTPHQILELLQKPQFLTELVYLDMSGWREHLSRVTLLKIIDSHPHLEYLGIVMCSVSFDPIFSDSSGVDFPRKLVIAGLGNEDQIKVTLTRCKDRSYYIQKALYHLFQLTTKFQEARPDIFQLVLPVMGAHLSKFGVQMAATACLYNLTRGEHSKQIHTGILGKGVDLTLSAMETFPEEFQLQKNSLLTLCSDRILQDVTFDRFRCARLVLDALCHFNDTNMDRMAVAICSILAAKVSTDETSVLGAKPEYMHKLLAMVRHRVETTFADITLKFTLSALWNLTDESSATCSVFLEQHGAELFLEVLSVFKDNTPIETKVLGLLNNIAEVPRLRPALATDALILELHRLLRSDNIDVSYFAAGIVAHLASEGEEAWSATSHTREQLLVELEKAVSAWKVPENEMVAYRSFRPFFPLLAIGKDYRIQLWAVWAVNHVCTKSPKRYCQMLSNEKGKVLFEDLLHYEACHPEIKHMSMLVLQMLDVNV